VNLSFEIYLNLLKRINYVFILNINFFISRKYSFTGNKLSVLKLKTLIQKRSIKQKSYSIEYYLEQKTYFTIQFNNCIKYKFQIIIKI